MSNTTNPPLVNSVRYKIYIIFFVCFCEFSENFPSYGMSENNVDKYLGVGYLARSDIEFKKLAGRGITIIIADG
jgi:hypothetical protein